MLEQKRELKERMRGSYTDHQKTKKTWKKRRKKTGGGREKERRVINVFHHGIQPQVPPHESLQIDTRGSQRIEKVS